MKKKSKCGQVSKRYAALFKSLLIMKVIVILLCAVGLMSSYADSDAQTSKLNFQIEKGTVKDVLEKIELQTGLSFMYDNNVFNVNRAISISVEDEPIGKVLEKLLEDESLKYERLNRYIVITPKDPTMAVQAKKGTVTGKVTNTLGESLPGVTIVIKGSTSGTITDRNGSYSISDVPGNETLVFSFVGMKSREIEISGRQIINVVMEEETIGLEEVVAIGYGSSKKKDLTSSITTVTVKDFNQGTHTNVMQLLQGKVPGLNITKDGNPNGATSIMLRGPSTLRSGAAQEPLYVVDGIPGGIVSSIDDIVSMDVLRDASATAIYGSRAANGVIIITTKRGEENNSKISYNSYLGIETISNKVDMLSADEYRSFLSDNNLPLDPIDEDNTSTDWMNEITRTGISHNNNVSIGGGTDKTTYFSSITYKQVDGIIRETGVKTLSVMANVQQKAINDRLKLGITVTNSISDSDLLPATYDDDNPTKLLYNMISYLPTVNIKNADGSFRENFQHPGAFNPVALIEQNKDRSKGKSFLATARIQFNVLKGLDYEINASYQAGQSNRSRYYNKESSLAQGFNGLAIRNSYETNKKLVETFASYNKTLKKHDFKLLAGYSWQEDHNGDGFQSSNTNFISDETGYNNLGMGSGYTGMIPMYGSTAITTLRMISGYARLNYSFSDKYLLQATVRRDGSSAFGKNSQWGTFPSVSVGWRLLEEPFLKGQTLFSNLKLRAGYGVSGNSQGFDPLISLLRYGKSGKSYYDGSYITGIVPIQNENPDLRWERTDMLNLGLDFSLFKNRLSGTFEYYIKNTKDLIWTYTVSATQFYVPSFITNVGKVQNKGFEISLNAIPVKTANFTWNTTLTFSHNKNNVESLSNDKFQLDYIYIGPVGDYGQSGMNSQIIQEGYPIGQYYLWKWGGLNSDGISQFYTKDGELTINPSTDDRFYAGNAQPKATGGWANTLTYRNFSLDFLFRGVTGSKILNVTMSNLNYLSEASHFNMPRMVLDEPITDNRSHYTSSRYLEKGDYIRLDNVTLAYTFKLNNPLIKNLRVYSTVNNVFTITGYNGLDPEVYMGGITPGTDDGLYYPKTRTFMFGLNVDF
ncbi:MAG: TonB-dependent receptor [Mangrovibacterium sp.]